MITSTWSKRQSQGQLRHIGKFPLLAGEGQGEVKCCVNRTFTLVPAGELLTLPLSLPAREGNKFPLLVGEGQGEVVRKE